MSHHAVSVLDSHRGPVAASWLVSCLLHGGLAVASIFFVQRLHLVPQADPFQWNVAMVAPLSPSSGATSPATSNVAPPPAAQRSTPPTTDAHPAVQPVQPRTTVPVDPLPPTPTSELSSEIHQEQSHFSEPSPSVPAPLSPVHPSPPVESQYLSNPLGEPVTPVHDSSTRPIEPQTSTDSLLDSSSVLASAAPTIQPKSTKADYAWLSAQMAKWIEDLDKRYPTMLRTEGVQGKVTLAAMLHENGLLSDVRVVRSSGNLALDQVALEDVKNGPPVTFSRSLERSQMAVKFSIVYDLKTIR